jgi:hypothetical protein
MHSFIEILVKTSTCHNHQGLRILRIRDIAQAPVCYLWTMVTTVQSSLDFLSSLVAYSPLPGFSGSFSMKIQVGIAPHGDHSKKMPRFPTCKFALGTITTIQLIQDLCKSPPVNSWCVLHFRPSILEKSTHTTPTLSPHTGLPPSTLPKPIPFPSLSHVLPPPGPHPPTAQLNRTIYGHLVQLDANQRPQVLSSTRDELGPSTRWLIASRRVRGDGGPTRV